MNDNNKVNIPSVDKMFEISMDLSDKRQMLHSAFLGMINMVVHQDIEFLFAGSHVGKRYNQKIDELGICSRVTFYDKITNKPLRRFVLRTPRADVPEHAYVYMHTWEYYNQRSEYDNRAIIDISTKVIQLFESLGAARIYKKKEHAKKDNANQNKIAAFVEEASNYLNECITKDRANRDLWGFGYERYRVKKSDYFDIRFNFKVDNRIVFAKVFRYLEDVDKVVMVDPKSTIRNVGHIPGPGVLNGTQLDIITGFLEICKRYCEEDG